MNNSHEIIKILLPNIPEEIKDKIIFELYSADVSTPEKLLDAYTNFCVQIVEEIKCHLNIE